MLKQDDIDTTSIHKLLPDIQAFQGLASDVLEDIASHMSLIKYEAGEHIIWAGSLGQYLLVIDQGAVYVSLDSRDIELGRGDIVGEMALLSSKPSKADVVALTDVQGFAVNHDDFQALMEKHAGLATAMTGLMRSRMFGDDGINRLGDYRVMDLISEASMPDVYRGIDTVSGKTVSIKMVNYEQASQSGFRERFNKDIAKVIGLKHPNILQVLETLEDYSTEFIIMEKLEGNNLKYHLEKGNLFDARQTSDVISKVALALEYACDAANGGMIHGDVNPSNIVLNDTGGVKLMGYGLAVNDVNLMDDEASLSYLAPELLLKNPRDLRTDIYALGVTAFFMLTGKAPYTATTVDGLIEEQKRSLSPDINSLVRDLPEGLAEFINRALVKDPQQRIFNWFEIQTLLALAKGSNLNLLADTDMDMALVIKLKKLDIDTRSLNQEVHRLLKSHDIPYVMEVVMKDTTDVDFSH